MNPDLQTFLRAWSGDSDICDTECGRLLQRLENDAAFRTECGEEIRLLGLIKAVQTPSPRWLDLRDALGLSSATPPEPEADDLARRVFHLVRNEPRKPANARWLTWRPLTAAAAGIVFGMFCTSMVFGFVVQSGVEGKTPLAVFQPSFEDAQMPITKGYPYALAHWGGDDARVVSAENGIRAKDGTFMLRLEAAPKGSPRFVYQVLDLASVPSSAKSEMREIEISASFAAVDAGASARYMLRAFAVSEAHEHLDASLFDHRGEAIASATKGLDVVPGSNGWKTVSLKIQVPPAARCLVLFFGVRTPNKTLPKAAHYLDDVQVSLIEPQPLNGLTLRTAARVGG
jgi:hypothetical protein